MTKYFVCDEHTLGYTLSDDDLTIWILVSSFLKGATFELWPGPKFPSQFTTIRPATVEDFAEYRVCVPPDFNHSKMEA